MIKGKIQEVDMDKVIIAKYETKAEVHLKTLKERFAMVVAATCYAGLEGDNVLVELNKLFDAAGY